MFYRLDRLTYDRTGLDLEVDSFNWIGYIKIVQSRSRLDQIVCPRFHKFSVWIKSPSPTSDTAIDVDLHQDQ